MVSVKLAENSRLGTRFVIEGLEGMREITPDESTSVPLRKAILGLKDPNLVFVFEESDREELLNLSEKLLERAFLELGKDLGTAEELTNLLLPQPEKKTKPKTTRKSALKKD